MDAASRRMGWAAGATALAAVVCAAGLEGGILPERGGIAIALAGAGVLAFASEAGGAASRGARVAGALLLAVVVYQLAPVPEALRTLVAPGQATALARYAPEWSPDAAAVSRWLTQSDLAAMLGDPQGAFDVLAGASSSSPRTGSMLPEALPWVLAQIAGVLSVYVLGARAARHRAVVTPLLVAFLLLAVGEALFGIAMRNGPSTGIGTKVYYLGSATGTFINRGHFAVFLALGAGAAWALAGAQFPLLPEEVERHARRVRRSSQPPGVLEASGSRVPKLVLLGFLSAILGVGVIASQSRGPLVALIAVACTVGAWCWRRRDEKFYLVFGVGFPLLTVAIGAMGFGVRGAFGRFAGVLSGGGDVSFWSRLQFWRDGLRAWADAPVFGAGFGAWRVAYGLRESVNHLYDVKHAHNELVEWLAEAGVVGAAALVLAVAVWVRGVVRALRALPHDDRSAAVLGCLVGVGAAALASLGDFPMHVPGVALAVALFAGLASGLADDAPAWGRAARMAVGLGALALGAGTAWADHRSTSPAADRLGEVPTDFLNAQRVETREDALARWAAARDAAEAAPLDPWRQARVARAAAWVNRSLPIGVEALGMQRDAFGVEAEAALARVAGLRPQDARLAVVSAAVLLDLRGFEASRRVRARDLLAHAVALDPWRAEAAFALTDGMDLDDLQRIAAGRGEGKGAAKVDYALGQALARRKEDAAAEAAYVRATQEDPNYGPAFFQLAAISHAAGDAVSTAARVHAFLAARDRPTGMEGWAYLMIGNLDVAEARFRASVATAPANRWAWEGLAELYRQRGDRRQEALAWKEVLAVDPTHAKALERAKALR